MELSAKATVRSLTPWGLEVKKRLLSKGLEQNDLVVLLQDRGCDIDKGMLSNLLRGTGASKRKTEIKIISDYLEIPYAQ